ncbi:THO complex subunit 1 isoform X1 isoform B [Micractinium conductrix]|uniref:THO complex subunit 1 isoform X1 isoform B n=1 Tax=Micractinium conductrix TaxID=554055 RepID=A0A2P6V5B8_9CHLO|nr:THO complex subunit 1 isoform X1 isoform B [Micractinium conductrix]|eukprot:PSC69291.1 THO complex subunit 1 isoform X1 isoform B [Micractinium conductrix]
MTPYEAEVQRLQALVLQALRGEQAPEASGALLVRLAFPEAMGSADGDTATGEAASSGVDPVSFRKLTAVQQEQLTNAVHGAARQLAHEARAASQPLLAYSIVEGREQAAAAQLLDAVVWLARQTPAPVEPGLAAQLLEEISEGASNADCEGLYAYLDSRTEVFKAPPLQGASKLTLLRTCNALLKRLSKSANALLCGRVLLFLAKLLPLTERSGVNLGGAFNTDNVTPVEEVAEGAVDSEGQPVDVAFYRTFWGLQSYFSNPPAALQPGKWGEVSRDIRRVLEKFQAEKVTVGEGAAAGAANGGQGASVKYLSSSRLMSLQLRDATFRRHFLLQCLILMQWCERPRQKEKKGLHAKLLEDLQDLRSKVYASLEATPDKGTQFTAAVRHLLQWEDAWAAWKQQSCPAAPLERPPAEAPPGAATADLTAPAPKRRKLGSDAVFGVRVGTDELDRLWNLTEDNLSALSADDRGGFKTVRQLIEPVIEEMQEAAAGGDDAGMLTASRSKLYSWKALRAVARTNLQAFAAAVQKGGDLEVAARAMYPSECPPPPATPPAPPKAEGEGKGGAMPAHPSGGAPADTTAATARRRGSDGGGEEAAGEEDGAVNGKAAGAAAAGEEGEEGEEGELPEDGEATAAHLEGEEEAEEGEAVVDAVAPMDAE